MADKQKTVEILFGGKDQTGQAISSVGRNLDSLQQRVSAVSAPLAGAADSILKLEAALATMGAAALAFATKEAITFEAALIDLQKVMGDGEGQASEYADQFADLSSRFGVEIGAVVQGAADFRQAGFDIDESLTLVEQSLLAVNAADLTTQQSTELLIGTLAGFQAPASEASRLLDVLNAVSNTTGTSVEQLGEGFKILGPVAKSLGLSFEETAALLTPVVEVTRSGSESANALKTAISNLIKPTKERKELLEEELGIQLEVNGERRDTKDVLYDLIEATQDLDLNERQRVATIIAGSEQMSRFLSVLNGAAKSEQVLQTALQASGSTIDEFNTKTQSAEFALKQLQSAFKTAAATAGLEYIDQTKAVTQATTNLVDSFREAISGENAEQLFSALRSGLDDLADRINIIAENLPEAFEGVDLTGLLDSFGDLGGEMGEAFEAVFGQIDLTTVEGLETALQKIVDGFTALTNVTSGIINGLEPLFAAIGTGIEEFQDLDSATQKSVGELLGLSKVIDTILPVLGSLGSGLESVGNGMLALAGAKGIGALTTKFSTLQTLAGAVGKAGLVGAVLVGSYGIGSMINDFIIKPLEEKFGTSIGSWLYEQFNEDELKKIEKALKPVSEAERKVIQDTKELRDINDRLAEKLKITRTATEETQSAWQSYANELVNAANKHDTIDDALGDTNKNLARSTNAVDQLTNKADKNGDALGKVGSETRKLAENNKTLVLGYDEATGKVNSWSGAIIKTGKSYDDAAEKANKAVVETEHFRIEMEKIASNERIQTIKAKVSLDIAEVEANAKKVEALAESIGKSFSDSTGFVKDLWEGYDDAGRSTQIDLAKQIRQENKLREEQFKLQKKLTEAEVAYIKEKTKQLSNDDAMIKIDGQGLQPHLEAFMFEILKEIQVRVNAEGEEMLLGLR